MVAAMLGPLRGGHRVHPRARRLRPDGEGHVVDGARRPPPGEGGGRRGRHRGGDGRLRGPHQDQSGVADLEVADDEECLADRARLPLVLPAAQRRGAAGAARRPTRSTGGSRSSTTSCRPRHGGPTTCARSSRAVVDDGDVLWMKPEWAKNVVTGLARVGGQPVGIVANQPMVLGGALDVNAADKAARFVWLCDAFGIPLVFLHDVPGFIVGSAVEKQGIIRHGAKMLFAVSEATVPKISVDPAQELRRRLLRDERARVRGRLHRRVADGRDRGDGPRRRGEHHPPQDARGGARGGAGARSSSSSPRRSAPTSTRTSPPATRSSTTSSTPPTPAARSANGLKRQPRQARRPPLAQARRPPRLTSQPSSSSTAAAKTSVWRVDVGLGRGRATSAPCCGTA